MNTIILITGLFLSCFFSQLGPTPEEEDSVEILVEGVATQPDAAPVAALREIGERSFGLYFTVIGGKYVSLGEEIVPPPLDTQRKKLVDVQKLKTGLFKARVNVHVPPDLLALQKELRERMVMGKGDLERSGTLISAREQARRDALKQGILEEVAERYPPGSAPFNLQGKVFFLGTVRETTERGYYQLLGRVKVKLVES